MTVADNYSERVTVIVLEGENAVGNACRALEAFEADPTLHVAVLQFPTGALDGNSGSVPHRFVMHKPVIAAIHGNCYDEWLVLLGRATTLRLAAETSQFGFPSIRRGVGPAAAVRSTLHKQIPYTALAWMAIAGEPISSIEAVRAGLIAEVLPEDQVEARVTELALKIAQLLPMALRADHDGVLLQRYLSTPAGAFYGFAMYELTRHHPDSDEGLRAILERRSPRYKGLVKSRAREASDA